MTEREAPRRSFAEFFAAEIAPGLPVLEAQRRDRRRNAYARLFGAAFVVVVAALIAAMLWHPFVGGAVVILFSGNWLLSELTGFTNHPFPLIPDLLRCSQRHR